MSRDGAPLSRNGGEDDPVVVVGAVPYAIDWNPDGYALVRAYAARVDDAALKIANASEALAREDIAKGHQPTDAEIRWRADWTIWFAQWETFYAQVKSTAGFTGGLSGPLPSEMWGKTEIAEKDLDAFRKAFAALLATEHRDTPPVVDPGPLEPVSAPGPLDGLGSGVASTITTVAIAAVAVVVGVVLLTRSGG